MPFRALLKAALLLATVVRLCFSGCLSVGTLTAGAAGAAGGAGGAVGAGGGLRCAAVAAVAPSRVALRVMRVGEPARGQMFEEPESAEPEPAEPEPESRRRQRAAGVGGTAGVGCAAVAAAAPSAASSTFAFGGDSTSRALALPDFRSALQVRVQLEISEVGLTEKSCAAVRQEVFQRLMRQRALVQACSKHLLV